MRSLARHSPSKTLAICGGAHALHDGLTDLLNVLYPLLQAEFGLSYAAIGVLRSSYAGSMAIGQIPSGWLAGRVGRVLILSAGTLMVAVGYGLAGMTGSLSGIIIGCLLAGAGGSTQHPIASSLVTAAYPVQRSRAVLGTYNFTGDIGKVCLPGLFAVITATIGWRQAMVVIAIIASIGAGVILAALYTIDRGCPAEHSQARGRDRPTAYWLLFLIHIADNLVRTGFLIFLPFLLRNKGADVSSIGLGLSLLFAGGAAGKLAMGWLGGRLGLVASVILTEVATTILILALLPLSLSAAMMVLPLLGVMLNGTSSVLYGTVPEFVRSEQHTKAFAIFYAGGSAADALGPFLFGVFGDAFGIEPTLMVVACVALTTVPMVCALRPALHPR